LKKEIQFLALWKLRQFTVIIIRKDKIKLGVGVDATNGKRDKAQDKSGPVTAAKGGMKCWRLQ